MRRLLVASPLFAASALLAATSLAAGFSATDEPAEEALSQTSKALRQLKTRPHDSDATPERQSDSEGPDWRVLQKNDSVARARFVGSWEQVRAGSLRDRDFRTISPPDLAAGLGLATVYGADTAGWFLSIGRFVHLKTTDVERGFPTFSYESLARLGWAVGVTSGTIPSARVFWDRGPGPAPDFHDLIGRAVAETPDTGAWIVAGHVLFATARGQSLHHAPACGTPLNDESHPARPSRSLSLPVENAHVPGMIVALVVDPKAIGGGPLDKPVARALAERFFGSARPLAQNERFLVRAHYALFADPAPPIDPSQPLRAIWNVGEEETIPKVETVRHVLEGTTVARGHLAVWSIDSLERGFPYRRADLVEIASLDPTILIEQRWATKNNFLRQAIYERPRALLNRRVAEAVARVNARLGREGFRLKIYDAYRPLSVTQRLWLTHPSTPYLAAPNRGSRHNRGAAIDCTLTDAAGRDVEMPSDYTVFDETAHRDYAGMSQAARRNLDILTAAMEAEAFATIREEWWHFDAPGWENYPVADVPLWPGPEDEPPAEPTEIVRNSDVGNSRTGISPADAHEQPATAGTGAPAARRVGSVIADRPALPYIGHDNALRPTPTAVPTPVAPPTTTPATWLLARWTQCAIVAAFFVALLFALLRR